MPFPAIYPFVAVKALDGIGQAALDALAVNDAGRCTGILALSSPGKLPEMVHYLLYDLHVPPSAVMVVHQLPARETFWEHPPLTARPDKVQQGVPYLAETIFTLSFRMWKHFFDNLPLAVGKVAWILSHLFAFCGEKQKIRNISLQSKSP